MGFVPDEVKDLPPPGLVNHNSLWCATLGWCAAMIHNGISHRPPFKSGAHRQVLLATIGWFLGYHITRYETYVHAKLDREMNEYIRHHPDDFVPKEKRTFAEILEPFLPVR